jgi:hypothetical protein
LRTAWKTDSFDFSRPDDDARTQQAQSTHDGEAITPTSGPLADVHPVHATTAAETSFAPDHTSTRDTAVHNASVTVLNDDRGASQQHNDWSFNSMIHSSIPRSDNDREQWDDHGSSTTKDADDAHVWDAHGWKNHGYDHHSNSGKHDSFKYGDSFNFKDKISVLENSNIDKMDHASGPVGHHGYGAPGSEPSTFSTPTPAIDLASSKHHGPDAFSNGPDHAWNGAHTHASHHDLMV